MQLQILFYGWWLAENLLTHFFALDFLLRVTETDDRGRLPLCLAADACLTLAVMIRQIPGAFLWDILSLLLYARFIFGVRASRLSASVTVVAVLSTFREALSAVILSRAAGQLVSASRGITEQVFCSMVLALLYALALWAVRLRYSAVMRQGISSYLFLLLLPCIFLVLLVRYLLRLDRHDFGQYLSSLGVEPWMALFLIVVGAAVVSVLLLEIFCRISALAEKEKRAALLENQLHGQRIYLEEAKRRGVQYASFQHDIDNHLLVLAGLLREKKWEQAESYLYRLRAESVQLAAPVQTGSTVLDVLLFEKLGSAAADRIRVCCDVRIPDGCGVDELDLCVLFSNIIDNAAEACRGQPFENRFLSLSARIRSHMLILEAVNSAGKARVFEAGTGLQNIRQIAEKYHGTMEAGWSGEEFRVSVLLCLPQKDVQAEAIHAVETTV